MGGSPTICHDATPVVKSTEVGCGAAFSSLPPLSLSSALAGCLRASASLGDDFGAGFAGALLALELAAVPVWPVLPGELARVAIISWVQSDGTKRHVEV